VDQLLELPPRRRSDGRTWHNPEGLRNTQSLAGMAWTHPIHWSADRDEVQDFEHTIRGPADAGAGTDPRNRAKGAGAAEQGPVRRARRLAAYANSHRFALSPHAKNRD
jgi:hypothetical protein